MKHTYKRGQVSKVRGFTLIELLVVIAIIGILAAIVLVSLSSARAKGVTAAVQDQLDAARSAAEVYASNNNNSYAGVCTSTGGLASITVAAGNPTGVAATCRDGAAGWLLFAATSTGATSGECVDATGALKYEGSAPASGTACP
ncbi:MAG TPA: type II secretion system protein [Candidatus Paceibacterota bacterium]|nr:type II secretion system protein [Candidatus Paceibacterota bacterium]